MNKKSCLVFLLLAVVAFIADYLYFKSFGFYENDYYHITYHLKDTAGDVISFVLIRLTNWFKGRPLAFLPSVFTFLGMRLGGIQTLYIFGYLILLINSFLVYKILRRIYPASEIFAVSGALMFCLFPADSTKIFLTYSYTHQTALTFLLTSGILYLKGWKKLSYFIILGALFSYEPAYMVFFGIPLLKLKWDHGIRKELMKHSAILISVLVLILVIRLLIQEERVITAIRNPTGFFTDLVYGAFLGPVFVLRSFFYSPVAAFRDFNADFILPASVILILILAAIWGLKLNQGRKAVITNQDENPHREAASVHDESFSFTGKLILTSLVLIGLSYTIPLMQYPVTSTYGRMSAVHAASSFGGAIFFGAICSFAYYFFKRNNLSLIAATGIAIYLSSLVCYNLLIQKDFSLSWNNQKTFWTDVKRLCPDITDSTLIFVSQDMGKKLPQTKYILTNSWTDPIVFRQIYQFPEYWKKPPRVFLLNEGWEKKIILKENMLEWRVPQVTWDAHNEFIPDSNIIVLRLDSDNKLIRSDIKLVINGKMLNFRPLNSPEFKSWKKGVLDNYLVEQK